MLCPIILDHGCSVNRPLGRCLSLFHIWMWFVSVIHPHTQSLRSEHPSFLFAGWLATGPTHTARGGLRVGCLGLGEGETGLRCKQTDQGCLSRRPAESNWEYLRLRPVEVVGRLFPLAWFRVGDRAAGRLCCRHRRAAPGTRCGPCGALRLRSCLRVLCEAPPPCGRLRLRMGAGLATLALERPGGQPQCEISKPAVLLVISRFSYQRSPALLLR